MSFQPISIIFELLKSSVSEFSESDFFEGSQCYWSPKFSVASSSRWVDSKISKIIQISVYRVRFSKNLVSDLANYHNGVPVRHHLFTNEFLIYLSVLSTQPKFNFNPLPVKSGLLVFFFLPGRGLVLGLLIFFLLSFSFSAFASLSSLVLFLLNSTLYSQNASAHVTYGINSKVWGSKDWIGSFDDLGSFLIWILDAILQLSSDTNLSGLYFSETEFQNCDQ